MKREHVPDLTLAFYGLTDADLDTNFQTGSFIYWPRRRYSQRHFLSALQSTYCGTVGAEYMHIVNSAEQRWFQQRLESVRSKPKYGNEVKLHLLERLVAAEGLENI